MGNLTIISYLFYYSSSCGCYLEKSFARGGVIDPTAYNRPMAIMEGNHTVVRLYEPIRERSWVSRCPSVRRGQSSSSQKHFSPHKGQQLVCHHLKEEEPARGGQDGPVKEVLSGQANSEEVGTVVEVPWLANLLALCTDCQDQVAMGNHHGAKNLHSPDDFESGQSQAGQRLTQGEGQDCGSCSGSSSLHFAHSLSSTATTTTTTVPNATSTATSPRTWARDRRLKKLWAMNSVHVEETLQSLVRQKLDPAAEFCCASGSCDAATTGEKEHECFECSVIPDISGGMEKQLSPAADNPVPHLTDSQPALESWSASENEPISVSSKVCVHRKDSEYDNELYLCLLDNGFGTTPSPADQEMHTAVPRTAEPVTQSGMGMKEEEPPSLLPTEFQYDESELQDAALRVAAKMEEVESIIQRVSRTSSDWTRDRGGWRDSASLGSMSGDRDVPQQRTESSEKDTTIRVEELRALGEELNRSLRRALQLDGLLLENDYDDWEGVSGIGPLLDEGQEATWDLDEESIEKFSEDHPVGPIFQHDQHHHRRCRSPGNVMISRGGEFVLGRKSVSSPSLSSLLASTPNPASSPGSLSPLLSPCSSRLSSPMPQPHSLLLQSGSQQEGESQSKQVAAGIANSAAAAAASERVDERSSSRSSLRLELNNTSQRGPAVPPMPTAGW